MNTSATRGWRDFGVVVIAVTVYAAVTYVRPALSSTLSCGLGLPPNDPGFADAKAQARAEAEKNGYLRVCDANLERFHIAYGPSAPILASLAFQPVDLSGTPFAQFESLGSMVEPDNVMHSRLYRGFRLPNGHTVTLFEQDMSVDGTNTWRDPKDEPERINGLPARLDVFQTPSGNAVSHLSWIERRRAYELWIDANVVDAPLRDQLFALAASLLPSVPACPNEVPPKPVRMGANGFPVAEPVPTTLTQAEIDVMLDRTKRPCK